MNGMIAHQLIALAPQIERNSEFPNRPGVSLGGLHIVQVTAATKDLITTPLYDLNLIPRISSECLVSPFAKSMSQSNMEESNAEKC
jgi:hypothetical protein